MKDGNEKRNRQRCKEETDTHRDENMMGWLEIDSYYKTEKDRDSKRKQTLIEMKR